MKIKSYLSKHPAMENHTMQGVVDTFPGIFPALGFTPDIRVIAMLPSAFAESSKVNRHTMTAYLTRGQGDGFGVILREDDEKLSLNFKFHPGFNQILDRPRGAQKIKRDVFYNPDGGFLMAMVYPKISVVDYPLLTMRPERPPHARGVLNIFLQSQKQVAQGTVTIPDQTTRHVTVPTDPTAPVMVFLGTNISGESWLPIIKDMHQATELPGLAPDNTAPLEAHYLREFAPECHRAGQQFLLAAVWPE